MSHKKVKYLTATLYTLIIVCIGCATIIEKYRGTSFVGDHIYGAWWFSALWALLTVAACAYMLQQRLYRRVALLLLHVSLVVILAGALTTHLFARRGTVALRTGETVLSYTDKDGIVRQLPFTLTLQDFRIINYPGTDAPLDYQSTVHASSRMGKATKEFLVSMNHVGNVDGYRLFQSSYDSDGKGVSLGVSYDPYGIAVTYTGYLMLLVGIMATLLSRKTRMRSLCRKAIAMGLLFVSMNVGAEGSLPVIDRDIAHRMGTIQVLYNNRICPLNTVATDFAFKMTGSASWHGYSADEIFFSWMIFYSPWEKELLLNNNRKGADERNAMASMFYSGQFTKIFPYRIGDAVSWYSPGGQVLPKEIPVKEQFFIKQSMDFLTEAIVTGQRERAFEIIAKIKFFQHEMIGDVLPSENKTQAEIFYNQLRSIKFPVLITLQLGLRWWLSGHIPLSNGYETMLFMAWVLLALTLLLYFWGRGQGRNLSVILWIGPLAACCCLLVAMMSGGSSQLSPLMPVLQSPLLSFHVMTVMCAYALFALQMLLGIYVLVLIKKRSSKTEKITALSQFLLYPAVFLLTIGIFLGAVWANVSWGCYWSWDPKESWALITLMVYAVPLHKASIGRFASPCFYHAYMIAAFLSVAITYFGVNYFLGGMHSYA